MAVNAHDVLLALDRATDRMSELVAKGPDRETLARIVAEQIRQAWPGATLCACLVGAEAAPPALEVLDTDGRPSAEKRRLQVGAGFTLADRAAAWAEALERPKGTRAVVRPFARGGPLAGLMALQLRPTGSDEMALAQLFLKHLATDLSLHLEVACRDGESPSWRERAADLERLANVGEIAGPLAHEFTNFLNVLLLQVAVLEYQLPPAERVDLAEIRRQGNQASEVVNRFYQYRRGRSVGPRDLDLNRLVADAVDELSAEPAIASGAVTLAAELDPEGPRVRGVETDLRRLLHFLVSNSVRAAEQGGKQVVVRTVAKPAAGLIVEDDGLTPIEEDLPHLFEVSHPNRPGVESLELSACRSVVRRLGGSIQAEARPDGGMRIRIDFAQELA